MRVREVMWLAIELALVPFGTGCQPRPPADAPSSPAPRAAASSKLEAPLPCDAHFEPKGDPIADLGVLVRACSVAHQEHELAPAREGRQSQSDAVQRDAFTADKGHCYRAYAVGDADIADIDVQIVGPDGRVLAEDDTHAGHAVVPSSGELCAQAAGTETVEGSVARGGGRYSMQVWAR